VVSVYYNVFFTKQNEYYVMLINVEDCKTVVELTEL